MNGNPHHNQDKPRSPREAAVSWRGIAGRTVNWRPKPPPPISIAGLPSRSPALQNTHVVGALESGWIRRPLQTHAALHLAHRRVLVLLHPRRHSLADGPQIL